MKRGSSDPDLKKKLGCDMMTVYKEGPGEVGTFHYPAGPGEGDP